MTRAGNRKARGVTLQDFFKVFHCSSKSPTPGSQRPWKSSSRETCPFISLQETRWKPEIEGKAFTDTSVWRIFSDLSQRTGLAGGKSPDTGPDQNHIQKPNKRRRGQNTGCEFCTSQFWSHRVQILWPQQGFLRLPIFFFYFFIRRLVSHVCSIYEN